VMEQANGQIYYTMVSLPGARLFPSLVSAIPWSHSTARFIDARSLIQWRGVMHDQKKMRAPSKVQTEPRNSSGRRLVATTAMVAAAAELAIALTKMPPGPRRASTFARVPAVGRTTPRPPQSWVANETRHCSEPFAPGASRAQWVERIKTAP
jgi:hypothetical protein